MRPNVRSGVSPFPPTKKEKLGFTRVAENPFPRLLFFDLLVGHGVDEVYALIRSPRIGVLCLLGPIALHIGPKPWLPKRYEGEQRFAG